MSVRTLELPGWAAEQATGPCAYEGCGKSGLRQEIEAGNGLIRFRVRLALCSEHAGLIDTAKFGDGPAFEIVCRCVPPGESMAIFIRPLPGRTS